MEFYSSQQLKDKMRPWLYYVIIGLVSFIALVFFPMLGSTINLGWQLPTTTPGWFVWIGTKILVSIVNVLIFHCFILQAKVNVKDNAKFKEANEILQKIKLNDYNPRSPSKFFNQQYGVKGVMIFIMTAASLLAFSQAILTFDYVALLTYLMTIVLGLIFGIIEMKKVEIYWIEEYYDYAKRVEQELASTFKQREELPNNASIKTNNGAIIQPGNDSVYDTGGNNLLDSGMDSSSICNNNTQQQLVECGIDCNNFLDGAIYPSNTTSNSSNNEHEKSLSNDEEEKK